MFQQQLATAFFFCFLLVPVCPFKAFAGPNGDCMAIEFRADGCSQCSEMHLATDQAIEEGWVVRRFDTKADPHISLRWQIQSVPTTILVRNGREMDRILGPVSYRELNKRLMAASSVDSLRSLSHRPNDSVQEPAPVLRGQSALALVPLASAVSARNAGATTDPASLSNATLSNAATSKNSRSDPQGSVVRIRVQEPRQEAVGTGTIIDSYHGEALVLTCGHLFRESQGQAIITIERFQDGQTLTYPATLIDFQAKDIDIGLLSFRPNSEVPVATLIPKNRQLVEGQPVFSWGCDRGAPPSRIDSRISKLNRYVGPSNVEVQGQPVEGRSGGGLFDDQGELIGVCYAADPSLNEGLYNGAEVVYQQLAKLGLQRLFNERGVGLPSESNLVRDAIQAPNNRMTLASHSEMTVILKDANGRQEQLHIPKPSAQLIQAVRDSTLR
jgi:hypothetical protein